VGLSWLGAEYLAKKWLTYKQILSWYFPWTYIYKFK
jgi:peptidoglycan hydrolase-like amidase